jgi:hypothetical protein
MRRLFSRDHKIALCSFIGFSGHAPKFLLLASWFGFIVWENHQGLFIKQ